MAAKGFIFHSEFTFRQWLIVPASIFQNFSTGQGDSAAGTTFQPQGRIFMLPLAGTDTSDWTYGIANIRFQTRLSGPGTSAGASTRTRATNPFKTLVTHDISDWDEAGKHEYFDYVHRSVATPDGGFFTYYTDANTPALTIRISSLDPYDSINFAEAEIPLQSYNFVRINVHIPPDVGQTFKRWNDETNSWETYDPADGVYVRFRSEHPLQVTNTNKGGHYDLYTTESLNNKPTYGKDANNNDVTLSADTDLQAAVAELRNLLNDFKIVNDQHLTNIENDLVSGNTNASIFGTQNHSDNLDIIDALGGVVKFGDHCIVEGAAAFETAPTPIAGEGQIIGEILRSL